MAEHRCAAGRRCRTRSAPKAERIGAPIATERGLCPRCTLSVNTACSHLLADAHACTEAVGDRRVNTGELIHSTPDPTIPLNTSALALRATLADVCEAAMGLLAPGLNVEPRTRHKARGYPVRDMPVITQAAAVLPGHVEALLGIDAQPVCIWDATGTGWHIEDLDGVDIALRLVAVHGAIHHAFGAHDPRRRLAMPCPVLDCGQMTLGIDNGQTDVSCTACGGRWTEREYSWLSTFLLSEHQKAQEERQMYEWLLAEQRWLADIGKWLVAEWDWTHRWLAAEQQNTLDQVQRLASMTAADLDGIDGYAVVEILHEMIKPLVTGA